MDDNTQAAGSPGPSPARGRGFASRKPVPATRGVARKNGRGRPAGRRGAGRGKGRGRFKTYEDPRTQAAYERMKELRDSFSDLAQAARPALEKVADYSIGRMVQDPTYHQEVPGFAAVQRELDARLEETIRTADSVLVRRRDVTTKQYHLNTDATTSKFHASFDYVTEDFYDGALNRAGVLAQLRYDGVPLSHPTTGYQFVHMPDDVAKDQGPYVVFRNGIEVPEPSRLLDAKTSVVRAQLRKPRAGPKRKAEEAPLDTQPESKKPAAASSLGHGKPGLTRDDVDIKPEGASTPRPRHIGGLLSAEIEQDGEPESTAPSPSPLEGQSPDAEPKRETTSKKELPDLPAGASEPDSRGVRTVSKRGPKANNRLIIPPQFDFDDDDIGFRDSTNDSTRKATRTTRGKYLNKPNSRTWHLDSTIAYYNCLDYEDGDLDPEMVKKYNVHPKYGFFLPDSVNESEAPYGDVVRDRPVVVVTPNGSTLHASRSVRAKAMDMALESDAHRDKVSSLLRSFSSREGISSEEITTEQMRLRDAQIERLSSSEPSENQDSQDEYEESARIQDEDRHARVRTLLEAAKQVDARPFQSQLPPANQRPERVYDAVRDIFSASEPPAHVDTSGLSLLADVAERYRQFEARGVAGLSYVDNSMIDPNLLSGLPQPPAPSQPHTATPNAFLQTALNPSPNPTPGFTHIAPAPPAAVEGRPQTPVTRVPFTNSGNVSQVLPPLRPAGRREKPSSMEGPPGGLPLTNGICAPPSQSQLAQEFGSPRGLVPSNPSHFYPLAPHRPFHPGFSVHEPGSMMPMSMQQQGPSMPAPPMPAYPAASPPSAGQAQLAPMPPRMGPSPPLATQVPPPAVPSPPIHGSRHRTSASSNGQNAAGKYRKIAAAPIPHNRAWAPNGGSELRLSNYDPKGSIKDYIANEPPPRSGPTAIRGWNVNNVAKSRNKGLKKEGSAEDTESPK